MFYFCFLVSDKNVLGVVEVLFLLLFFCFIWVSSFACLLFPPSVLCLCHIWVLCNISYSEKKKINISSSWEWKENGVALEIIHPSHNLNLPYFCIKYNVKSEVQKKVPQFCRLAGEMPFGVFVCGWSYALVLVFFPADTGSWLVISPWT